MRRYVGSKPKADQLASHTKTTISPPGASIQMRSLVISGLKNQMPSASRQRLLLAARNLSMLCFPEGVCVFKMYIVSL